MHHSHRSSQQIRHWLEQFLPVAGNANALKFLPLALLGLIGSGSCHLNRIAAAVPWAGSAAGVLQRVRRWIGRSSFRIDDYLAHAVRAHLQAQAQSLIVVAVDRTDWKQANLLYAAVSYHGRCLPLASLVLQGPKATHHEELQQLLQRARQALPEGAQVVVVADREFGNIPAIRVIQQFGWHFCLRFKTDTWLYWADGSAHQARDLYPWRGRRQGWTQVSVTLQQYGPLNLSILWATRQDEPWILISDLDPRRLAALYRRRMHIDEMFSDLKKRGFQLEDTRLRDPQRLGRLLALLSLTYLWLLLAAAIIIRRGCRRLVDPASKRQLSYLQIALRLCRFHPAQAESLAKALATAYDEK
jgi:hypothetical protein